MARVLIIPQFLHPLNWASFICNYTILVLCITGPGNYRNFARNRSNKYTSLQAISFNHSFSLNLTQMCSRNELLNMFIFYTQNSCFVSSNLNHIPRLKLKICSIYTKNENDLECSGTIWMFKVHIYFYFSFCSVIIHKYYYCFLLIALCTRIPCNTNLRGKFVVSSRAFKPMIFCWLGSQ